MSPFIRLNLACAASLAVLSCAANTAADTDRTARADLAAKMQVMVAQCQQPTVTPAQAPAKAPAPTVSTTYALQALSPENRAHFAGFLDEVLRQVDSAAFYELVDKIMKEHKPKTDQELYEKLMKELDSIKPNFVSFGLRQIDAQRYQQKVLATQTQKLLDGVKQIDGIVEIGTSGVYMPAIIASTSVTGMKYALNDSPESVKDLIKIGGQRPYDKFMHLDYSPIPESAIPTNSVDVVVCYIGLHHCPQTKLHAFIGSIRRILRPGGVFILRDHDAKDAANMRCAHAAHTVFNLVTGETLETEMAEYRNFQPLDFWIKALEEQGLKVGTDRILQDRDPSINTLMKFTKVGQTPEEKVMQLKNELKAQGAPYEQDLAQSYLSAPEWNNVDAAQEQAAFFAHSPTSDFPYMRTVATFWKIFFRSLNAARKKQGLVNTVCSASTVMNSFIGTGMTIEALGDALSANLSSSRPAFVTVVLDDPNNEVAALDSRIKVVKAIDTTSHKEVQIPRYKAFSDIMQQLPATHIKVVQVAGLEHLHIKIRHKKDAKNPYEQLDGCKKEIDWIMPTQPDYVYSSLCVEASTLQAVQKALTANGAELLLIHTKSDVTDNDFRFALGEKEYAEFINHTPYYMFPHLQTSSSFKALGRAAWSLPGLAMQSWVWGVQPLVLQAIVNDPHDELAKLDPRIKVLRAIENTTLKYVEIPRYKEFLKIMSKLPTTRITMVEICGNKEIQFKIRHKKTVKNPYQSIDGCTKEYGWTQPTQPDYWYAAITVQIEKMHTVVKQLQDNGVELLLIHDF